LNKLQSDYLNLQHTASIASAPSVAAASRPSGGPPTVTSDEDIDTSFLLRRRPSPSINWAIRSFLEAPVARYLVRMVDNGSQGQEMILADCNRKWSDSLGLQRDQMLGRPVKEFLAPVNWHRWVLGAQMVLRHGMIVVRNAPCYRINAIADVIGWVEYDDDGVPVDQVSNMFGVPIDEVLHDSPGRSGRRWPKYFQAIHVNERPFYDSLETAAVAAKAAAASASALAAKMVITSEPSPRSCSSMGPTMAVTDIGDTIGLIGQSSPSNSGAMLVFSECESTSSMVSQQNPSWQAQPQRVSPFVYHAESCQCDQHERKQALPESSPNPHRDVSDLADQCAIYLRLGNGGAEAANADEDVVVSPWNRDGSDELNAVGPLTTIKRSELSRSVPHLLHDVPDLLSPSSDPSSSAMLSFMSSSNIGTQSDRAPMAIDNAAAASPFPVPVTAQVDEPVLRYHSVSSPLISVGASRLSNSGSAGVLVPT